MERNDLLKILEGDISLIDSVNVSDIALPEVQIYVEPNHVRKMLLAFITSKIYAENLTKWASFICLRAEYGSIYNQDEKIPDYYEDMFYIIQRLSTPQIDGEVNEIQVMSYLSELDKYFK